MLLAAVLVHRDACANPKGKPDIFLTMVIAMDLMINAPRLLTVGMVTRSPCPRLLTTRCLAP